MYRFKKKKGSYIFYAPAKNGTAKYDVYDKNEKFLTSIGSRNYQQYHDKIGYYSKLDHKDRKRRQLYHIRHRHNKGLAGMLALHYLW